MTDSKKYYHPQVRRQYYQTLKRIEEELGMKPNRIVEFLIEIYVKEKSTENTG